MCGNERASGYETSIVSYSDGFLPSQSILGALLGTLVRRRENACRVFHLNRFIKTDEQSRLLCARELYWSGSEFKVSPVVQSSSPVQWSSPVITNSPNGVHAVIQHTIDQNITSTSILVHWFRWCGRAASTICFHSNRGEAIVV